MARCGHETPRGTPDRQPVRRFSPFAFFLGVWGWRVVLGTSISRAGHSQPDGHDRPAGGKSGQGSFGTGVGGLSCQCADTRLLLRPILRRILRASGFSGGSTLGAGASSCPPHVGRGRESPCRNASTKCYPARRDMVVGAACLQHPSMAGRRLLSRHVLSRLADHASRPSAAPGTESASHLKLTTYDLQLSSSAPSCAESCS